MTVATVVALARDILSDEPWSDTINASYTAPATTFTITDYAELVRGDKLDFQDDGTYDLFIVDATPSSSTVTVGISYDGATNASHANGARYYKSPRYPSKDIVAAITHVVNTRLWPEVWVPTVTTLTPSPLTTNIYDLPSDYESFISLVQVTSGAIEDLSYVTKIEEMLSVPAAISSTLKALRVPDWVRDDVGATLTYRARVSTTNMTSAMEPTIALGAAAYILGLEAGTKSDRVDEDDRSGRMLRSYRELWAQFEQEKSKLRAQLLQQWGPIRRFRR
jgi:hypothetical protein